MKLQVDDRWSKDARNQHFPQCRPVFAFFLWILQGMCWDEKILKILRTALAGSLWFSASASSLVGSRCVGTPALSHRWRPVVAGCGAAFRSAASFLRAPRRGHPDTIPKEKLAAQRRHEISISLNSLPFMAILPRPWPRQGQCGGPSQSSCMCV